MSAQDTSPSAPSSAGLTRWAVTAITLVIAALSFAFCFGNSHDLCVSLGLDGWIAWLIGPSVDLSVIGLLVGVRYLASVGYTGEELAKPRRLLTLCGLLTLALNTADALTHRQYGTAAVNAIGPILLICWSDVGPWLMAELATATHRNDEPQPCAGTESNPLPEPVTADAAEAQADPADPDGSAAAKQVDLAVDLPDEPDPERAKVDLWVLALHLDAEHRADTGRPISRDALRNALHIGRDRASDLKHRLRQHAADAARSTASTEAADYVAAPDGAFDQPAAPALVPAGT